MDNYRKVNHPHDVRPELHKSAAAALALGLDVQEFRVRDLTVLHIDGSIFEPHRTLQDALALLFYAQKLSVQGASPIVRVVCSAEDTRVQIGAGRWHRSMVDDHGVRMRDAILGAFAAFYYEQHPAS